MKYIFLQVLLILLSLHLKAQQNHHPRIPSDSAASVGVYDRELTVFYDGQCILKASLHNDPSEFYLREVRDTSNGIVNQAFTPTSRNGQKLELEGIISGSTESFPCESDRKQKGIIAVRNSVGLSHSLLNRAVYDRQQDWVISVDQSYASADLLITPRESNASGNTFSISIKGEEITFRFRPHYYQKHRGLSRFEPWAYPVWDKPVVGWCSWFAFFNKVTEQDIKNAADVISEVLKPYGLEYLQIDDGYQQQISTPEKWLNPNPKFPGGMNGLAAYILSKGLKPGIWTNVAFSDKEYATEHGALFVTDKTGKPAEGRWIGNIIDGSNPATLSTLVKPVYKGFSEMGWQYFKLDALRHLRYEGYNSNNNYFEEKKVNREDAFRDVVKTVRNEIGRDKFLMACWGIRPELIGLVDGCRIGDDGFGYAGLTQYNSFNNIIWRNDPDHIELSPKEAYRSCMVTSLTGSLFMLTDKPEKYRTSIIDPAIHSIPVLFTRPGQLYDVDPSCSDRLSQVNTEMSGSGERCFDASRTSPYDLFLLELNKPYENWMVLGRTGESVSFIPFADLGLSKTKDYLVFEFWTKQFKGAFTSGFKPGNIDTSYNCQLFCIREKSDHPQLLATNRHISCGALEVSELSWSGSTLSGKSEQVTNDQYTLYLYEPEGFFVKSIECPGCTLVSNQKNGEIREVTFTATTRKIAKWTVNY